MEVYTTNDFAHDGNIYHPELDLEQPKGCLSYTSNHVKNSRKINNRSYDINTSNYKKLTTNKDAKVIELYDDLWLKGNIENNGFYTQKHRTFNISHLSSRNDNAMKCHYFFIQFAHTFRQLLEKGNLLVKSLKLQPTPILII